MQALHALLTEQGNVIKSFQREAQRPPGKSEYNWLLTFTGCDSMEFAMTVVSTLIEGMRALVRAQRFFFLVHVLFWFVLHDSNILFSTPHTNLSLADSGMRSVVLAQLEAMRAFFMQADLDKDRKAACGTFEKQLKRLFRAELKDLPDESTDAIFDRAQFLLCPPHKRFAEKSATTPGRHSRAAVAAQLPAAPTPAPAPIFYPQAQQPYQPIPPPYQPPQQPVYASPSQPACPPGYQLTPVSTSAPSPPPGGGRPPPRGIAATKPGEVFPPTHFTRPCHYCSHAGHAGDNCWKTYPELRALNGR